MNDSSQLILAAILHDIGKIGYRAGESGTHEEIGNKLVLNYENVLPHEISSLISLHHRHKIENLFDKEGYIILKKIILADWLASAERIGVEQTEDIKKVGLAPIFSQISIFKEYSRPKFYYIGREMLLKDGSSEIFPKIESEVSGILQKNFSDNWNSFKRGFEKIANYKDNELKLFEYLYSLLKKHGKFLPSAAYKVEPDISLFDHSKMVCALAIALHNYFKFNSSGEKETTNTLNKIGKILQALYQKGDVYINEIEKDQAKREIFESQKFFCLIHGDFSGIQNFIHLISSKHAMKTLKGRSFFFSLLTENFSRFVVQELNLTVANIIFAGGGHFFIISHYSNELDSKIKEFSVKINKLFVEQFNSNLFLALEQVPLSIKDLIKNVSKFWKEVSAKTSIKKNRKFKDILEQSDQKYFSEIFGPIKDTINKTERCIVCNSYTELENIKRGSDDKWCLLCKSFVDLTDDLRRSKFLRITEKADKNYNLILNELHNAVEFEESKIKDQNLWYSINNPSMENTLGDMLLPVAFPLDKDKNIIDNDYLGSQAAEKTGFNKLGILKMDVDSLGKIFQKGLGDNSTISRISTLSSSLSLFFEGYVSKLVQTEFSGSVYLIFSGGDDLFAVGSWDKIIEFAFKLYKDFRRFTAFNPDITLSAGITLESPTFPIIKASLAAEEALDNAKNFEVFTGEKNTKNRISLLGSVLRWDWSLEKEKEYQKLDQSKVKFDEYHRKRIFEIMNFENEEQINEETFKWINDKSEFELAIVLKDILVYLLRDKDFPKSVLHKIEVSIRIMKKLFDDSLERKISVPKLWRIKYYLRNVLWSKDQDVKKLSNFIVNMIEIVIKNNLLVQNSNLQIKNVEFISVGVKWADYLTRNINK